MTDKPQRLLTEEDLLDLLEIMHKLSHSIWYNVNLPSL